MTSVQHDVLWSFPGHLSIRHALPKGETVEIDFADDRWLVGRKYAADLIRAVRRTCEMHHKEEVATWERE